MEPRRFSPAAYEDIQPILVALKQGVALEIDIPTDRLVARRLVDTLSGAVFALDGRMRKIGNRYKAIRG